MKKLLSLFGFLLIIGLASQASALTIYNTSFETGDFTRWTANNASVVTSTWHPDGNYASKSGNGSYYAEITGLYDTEVESGSGRGTIQQIVSWAEGDTYTFDWAFLGFDGDLLDYAYYKIGDGPEVALLEVVLDENAPKGGAIQTPWAEKTITFSGIGTDVVFEFGVVSHALNSSTNSKLLVDAKFSAVPEPATMLLFGLGLLGIAGVGRKKA